MTRYEESIGFFNELGLAVTQWSHVELALLWIVASCYQEKDRDYAAITFYSVDAFHNKMKIADRLVKTKYSKIYHQKWDELRRRIEGLAKIRNNLVHYFPMGFTGSKPGRRHALIPQILPTPSRFKQRKPSPPSGSYCIKEISHACRRFAAAAHALESFLYELTGREAGLPVSFAQDPHPLSPSELTLHIRSMLKSP